MDHDKDSESGPREAEKPGRGWTERVCPLRYRRFSDLDAGGRPSIFFQFEQVPGQEALPPEIWDIIRSVKYLDRGPDHGGGQHHTGLAFNRSKKHGRVWRLSDNPTGRTAADILDVRLAEFAERIDREKNQSR